jgi:hypothetical protein
MPVSSFGDDLRPKELKEANVCRLARLVSRLVSRYWIFELLFARASCFDTSVVTHNRLLNEMGFVTATEKPGLFLWFEGDKPVMKDYREIIARKMRLTSYR